jgi:hypothetical protein
MGFTGKGFGMTWDRSVGALLEDLEQQAQGLALAERDAEVVELTLAEYAQITLAERLHASRGARLRIRLVGGLQVDGALARAGEDWVLLVDDRTEWLVRHDAVSSVAGVSARADHAATWPVVDRLSLRALLRRLAADGDGCVVHFVHGERAEGRIGRVGKDFFELATGTSAGTLVVPVRGVAALQSRS